MDALVAAYTYTGVVSVVPSSLVTDPQPSMASAFSMAGGAGAELAGNGLFKSPQLANAVPLSGRVAFDDKTRCGTLRRCHSGGVLPMPSRSLSSAIVMHFHGAPVEQKGALLIAHL